MTASHPFNCKDYFVLKKGFLSKSIANPFLSTKLALKTALKGNQETIPILPIISLKQKGWELLKKTFLKRIGTP